jgi:hypothetical protein
MLSCTRRLRREALERAYRNMRLARLLADICSNVHCGYTVELSCGSSRSNLRRSGVNCGHSMSAPHRTAFWYMRMKWEREEGARPQILNRMWCAKQLCTIEKHVMAQRVADKHLIDIRAEATAMVACVK